MKTPAAAPAGPNPAPLLKALTNLDRLQAGIVSARADIVRFQGEYDQLIATGNPNDPDLVRDVGHLKTKLVIFL